MFLKEKMLEKKKIRDAIKRPLDKKKRDEIVHKATQR